MVNTKEKQKTACTNLRLSPEMKALLRRLAKDDQRSMTAYIERYVYQMAYVKGWVK